MLSCPLPLQEANKREYAPAVSRSTSAGSRSIAQSPAGSRCERRELDRLPSLGFLSLSAPVPVIVRNTFIYTPIVRTDSLGEFFQRRRIRSCPVAPARSDREHLDFDDDMSPPRPEPVLHASTTGTKVLGSHELPTVGSVGHHIGTCKPCAFFHAHGCGKGAQCSFCHLCPPDEKRRRERKNKKEKQATLREMCRPDEKMRREIHQQRRQVSLCC